jgi:hypothetical protein
MRKDGKVISSLALSVATQTAWTADITNYSGISAMLTCPASAAGSMFLEWCGTNSTVDADWSEVPIAQYPNATATLAASSSKIVHAHALHAAFVRVRVTLSAGAGTYSLYITTKDF